MKLTRGRGRAAGRAGGFTLLEMAVALLIVGLIAAMGATMARDTLEAAAAAATRTRLDAVEAALMAYRRVYDRLPCPADPRLPPTDPNSGAEAANPGACTGGTPAAPFADATRHVVEGAVPTRQLGIPDEFLYDGWGRRLAYAVDWRVTAAHAMRGQAVAEQCGIKVTDAAGGDGARTAGAVYALVSFGPDGHGAYLRGGGRMAAGVTNADELTNCHCDATAAATAYAANYVAKDLSLDAGDPAHPFDDLVRFKDRWQMMTDDDRYAPGGSSVCGAPGFRADGFGADQETGYSGVAAADVDHDNIPDLIIAQGVNIYVVFGTTAGFPDPLPLSSLDGSNGFTITTPTFYGPIAAGDVNGDGYADILVGGVYSHDVEVLFGHARPWPASVALDPQADGTHGLYFHISSSNHLGDTVSTGDLNGDGIDDMIFDDDSTGRLYVIFGKASGWAAALDPSALADGTQGFYLNGRTNESGHFDPSVGKVNGDSVTDLLIGDVYGWGVVDVVFGHSGSWAATNGKTLGSLLTSDGTYFYDNNINVNNWNSFGRSTVVGDVNGDGVNEILIAEARPLNGGTDYSSAGDAGQVFVIPTGGFSWGSASYNVATLVSQGKASWITADQGGTMSVDLGPAADLNKDGINDIVVDCSSCTSDNANGSVYVIYGKSGALGNRDLALTPLNGGDGFRIDCSYAADAGHCAAADAADLNGDGIPDLILPNALGAGGGQSQSGYTYVLFGNRNGFTNPYPLSRIY